MIEAPAGVARRPRRWLAALTLFLLAGLIPETVATYNTPPLVLLARPLDLLFLSAFYGSVALLVREFMRRRAVRWASILLLGMAAGCINEGIIAGTWYKVQDGGYALIGGMAPAVAVGLTVFHALYSTVLPILLVELMFPRVAGCRWLGRSGLAACSVLLALATASGFGAAADRGMKAVVLIGVTVLAAVALALPGPVPRPVSPARVPGLGRLRLVAAFGTVAFFAVFGVIPAVTGSAVPADRLAAWQILFVVLMCATAALSSLSGAAGAGAQAGGSSSRRSR
jgi:hypothetical protein